MARLTEEMVIARSKQSDLSSIKKLNCWGADLVDVSLLRRMPNVEVLAFSINKIGSLSDFAHCSRLQELYVRKNNIRDLAEIRHLACLPRLTSLWLEENPCADEDNYRMTVLRALPRLQKLDNIVVQPDEVQEAMRKGTPITEPDDSEYYDQQDPYNQYRGGRSNDSSPERLQERPEPSEYRRSDQGSDCSDANSETNFGEVVTNGGGHGKSPPGATQTSPRHRAYSPEPVEDSRYEHPASRNPYYDRSPPSNVGLSDDVVTARTLRHTSSTDESHVVCGTGAIRHSQSAQSVKDYVPSTNGGEPTVHSSRSSYHHGATTSPQYASNRHSADFTTQNNYAESYYERGERSDPYQSRCPADSYTADREPVREREHARRERDRESVEAAAISSAVMAEHRGFTRRPVTRNSNLLSAVLCLVKELDYPSLEVAEMAVRCRMDELANHQ